jgi:hypothetical protein
MKGTETGRSGAEQLQVGVCGRAELWWTAVCSGAALYAAKLWRLLRSGGGWDGARCARRVSQNNSRIINFLLLLPLFLLLFLLLLLLFLLLFLLLVVSHFLLPVKVCAYVCGVCVCVVCVCVWCVCVACECKEYENRVCMNCVNVHVWCVIL